jgi:hypothetical protein
MIFLAMSDIANTFFIPHFPKESQKNVMESMKISSSRPGNSLLLREASKPKNQLTNNFIVPQFPKEI